jgi:uncharacterized protein YyaL (SSP411 family)
MSSRLAGQQSAYLRSAKDQPVDWHPWGAEAFERAAKESKPILLDIGAVWCHWCHVMDHESYEDPALAEQLNRDWICIKVDRDERPDVDARYQRAVQALTAQGGWPLTAFLTPQGEVFYGGTYFPPDGRHGRPGFRTVLSELTRLFHGSPERVREQADVIIQHLDASRPLLQAGKLTPELLGRAANAMAKPFDFRHGGFGTQPKFPHPGTCDFLLSRWHDTGEPWAAEIVQRTLTGMARGGIRDHLGGGFHRYSVDQRWIVPHFEKMSYDNAELLRVYVRAAAAELPARGIAATTGAIEQEQALYEEVIEGAVQWIRQVMSDPDGGYYASQDADVGPDDDGDYFTWTPDEAQAALDAEEWAVLSRRYDIDDAGEMHHNPRKNVLWLKQSPREIATALEIGEDEVERLLRSGRDKLLQARAARPTPFVDTTLYSGWSALMASALFEAGAHLARPELDEHALVTLDRLFREAATPDLTGGMGHAIGSDVSGIVEDQVYVAQAVLDAYEVSGERRWLDRAEQLMAHVMTEYSGDDGALLDTPRESGGEGFLSRPITPIQDSPTPSPNGIAGIVLSRLAELTGRDEWRSYRDDLLEALAGAAEQLAIFGAALIRAIDWAVMPATHIAIVGADDERTAALVLEARRAYRPRKVITRLAPGAPTDHLPEHLRAMVDGAAPRAYVCAGTQCTAPVETAAELANTLATLAARFDS